jgi:plastocyanin
MVLLLGGLVACSKEETPAETATQPAAQPAAGPVTTVDPATAASVGGSIKFQNGAPRRPTLRMDADAACANLHAAPVQSDEVVVNDNGTLRNVFVYVSGGLAGKNFAVPTQPVVLDQHGCVYTPHVVGVMANQEVHILNSDPTTHNIHPVPKVNREWNTSMPPNSEKLVRTFAREEVAIPVKCNIHPWMRSYVAVVNHPFFSVSGADGKFNISGLPPGEYTITAWHEKYGSQEQKVTVAAKETKSLEFTFRPTSSGD